MALTITQIHKLFTGMAKPQDASLRDLVMIAGAKHAQWFANNKKETDDGTLARSYVDKMDAILLQMTSRNENTGKNITYNLCVYVANTYNYAAIEAYSTTQWEDMVDNNLVTSLEITAGITNAERTAYNAL